MFRSYSVQHPMHESLKFKLRTRLAKQRPYVAESISRLEFSTALSRIDDSTHHLMLKKQDYDRYRITPYSQEVTEKYSLDGYVNVSIVDTPSTRYFAAQMPKPRHFGLFRDFVKKSGAGLIVSLIDCADEDYFDASERMDACSIPFSREDDGSGDCGCFYDETYDIGMPVRRLRFCSWEDHMSPNPDKFKAFYEYFRQLKCEKVVVHCHAGVGRTGTFIMYDMLFERREVTLDAFVDVLLHLRSCRPYMVFKAEQLEFLARSFLLQDTRASESDKQNQKRLLHY